MFSAIHNPGQRPYLYNNGSNQPVAINQAVINNVDVSGVLPVGLVGDKHALNPQTSKYQCSEGIGYYTNKYDAWIVDGEYYYNRLYSNPTDSDTTMFNTVKQQQHEDMHNRLPMIIPNNEHNNENIYTSTIKNTKSTASALDTNDKVERVDCVSTRNGETNDFMNMFKQKRKRFGDIDNDYESNLPVFMRNSRLNFVNLTDKSPIDTHTDKLIANSKNKLLQEDKLDENTRWNNTDEDIEWTTTHNPQSEKTKDNNTFDDGINETFLTSTPKYYSANERREYFNNKLRTNAGNYINGLVSDHKDTLLMTLEETEPSENNAFITNFDFNKYTPQYYDTEQLTQDITNNDDYFMVNDSEYIYIDQQPKETEKYTIISTTNDEANGLQPLDEANGLRPLDEANDGVNRQLFERRETNTLTTQSPINKETFNNITTGRLLYKHVLQSYSIMLVNFLSNFEDFKPWIHYWRYLHKNLYKCNCIFEILKPNDKDVAYVQNKGEKMRFRIQDKNRFVPISIYTYVLCHELAHLANEHEYGHGQNFQDLMHLIELAAYELGIIKPEKYPEDNYTSNDMVILSKSSIKQELIEGINLVVRKGANRKFYTDLANKIDRY